MPTAPPPELRCACGALLARRVPEGIELRCRRCHRTLVLRADALDAGSVELTLCDAPDRRAAPRVNEGVARPRVQ